MKILTLLSLLVVLLFSSCGGKMDELMIGSISVKGAEYEIHLIGSDSTETIGIFKYEAMELRNPENGEVFLRQDSLDNWAYTAEGEPGMNTLDYTFDGNEDIQIQTGEHAYQEFQYDLWIYDESSNSFKYSNFLQMMPDGYFDEENELIGFSYDNSTGSMTSHYAYKDGEFVEMQYIERYTNAGGITTKIISERVNGELVETERETSVMGLSLKKSGEFTSNQDVVQFLEVLGNNSRFAQVLREDDKYLQNHDSCSGERLTFAIEDEEELYLDVIREQFPIIIWESMYEGPEEFVSIRSITYHSNGDVFTVYGQSFYYEDEIYWYDDDIDTRLEFRLDDYTWAASMNQIEGNKLHFMDDDWIEDLDMSDEPCEDYEY